MTTKWDGFRGNLKRLHEDFEYGTITLYNHSQGSYDPDEGQITGQTRSQVASFDAPLIPPSADTTIDGDGTDMVWSASTRFPTSKVNEGDLKPLGVENEKPTEVEVADPQRASDRLFELHSYSIEKGSGMYLCRLVEQ